MALWRWWKRVRDRVQPHARRGFFATVISLTYIGGLVALVGVPLQLFLIVTRVCGTVRTGSLYLNAWGEPLLLLIAALTLVLSVAIGGVARVILEREHFGRVWLAVLTLTSLYAVSATLDDMRAAVSALHRLAHGDDTTAGAFLGFWILMVGYAAKSAWDESRDRVASRLRRQITAWDEQARAREARRCPHCGQVMPPETPMTAAGEVE